MLAVYSDVTVTPAGGTLTIDGQLLVTSAAVLLRISGALQLGATGRVSTQTSTTTLSVSGAIGGAGFISSAGTVKALSVQANDVTVFSTGRLRTGALTFNVGGSGLVVEGGGLLSSPGAQLLIRPVQPSTPASRATPTSLPGWC